MKNALAISLVVFLTGNGAAFAAETKCGYMKCEGGADGLYQCVYIPCIVFGPDGSPGSNNIPGLVSNKPFYEDMLSKRPMFERNMQFEAIQ